MKREQVENWVIITVMAVWAFSFILDPFVPGYTPRPEVGFAMGGIIGALWGSRVIRRTRNGGRGGT